MKNPIFVLLKVAVLFLSLCVGSSFAAQGTITGGKAISPPDWFKESFLEIAEDVAEANESGKHVILFLEMNGCPYCYKMNEENFKNAPYKAFIQQHFDVISLNVKGDREVALNEETMATEKEIAEQLGVQFTPGLVFLNTDNQVVAKFTGYRSVRDFKVILDFVQQKAYSRQSLNEFIKERKETNAYTLMDHPQFKDVSDLSSVASKPLAVIFEDKSCFDCKSLHEGHLAAPEVRKTLESYTVVRLDAMSDKPMTDLEGNKTTVKQFADSLNVSYTPAIVLFDEGEEKLRLENMLYRYHFVGMLEYVGNRHYKKFPDSPFDYVNNKTDRLLADGKDVNIGKY